MLHGPDNPMTRQWRHQCAMVLTLIFIGWTATSCSHEKPAPTKTEVTLEPGIFNPDHPELFKVVQVQERQLPTLLSANCSIVPDVNRTIHVTSQGSGRVVDLRVKLGDYVKKGQTLLSIYSSDLSGAFSDYQKAVVDELLAKRALDRTQVLYSHGAAAEKDLELAQDAEDKAKVDVATAAQHVHLLGGDPAHPSSLIELRAPAAGTIVEQNISGFEGIKSLDNSPNLFTIADLSQVWVLCDVFENDLGDVNLGDPAEVRLNAFPERIFRGQISDISRVLDPNTRSAKVRIVLGNRDGDLRPGMYATAGFRSRRLQRHLIVPDTSVMRLQDRDWAFRKENDHRFHQIEVKTIGETPDGMHEVQEGDMHAGDEIVTNALEFSSAMAGQGK